MVESNPTVLIKLPLASELDAVKQAMFPWNHALSQQGSEAAKQQDQSLLMKSEGAKGHRLSHISTTRCSPF